MSESTVAIIGSGIAAATVGYLLTKQGHDVAMFEIGPDYPYPFQRQFAEEVLYLYNDPAYILPPDLFALQQTGDYGTDLNRERSMLVGGMATRWSAWTPRIHPEDFRTRSRYGFGEDWPLSYDDLERWYCAAEWHLGISGTDEDNPFAPPRSRPYPLPAFPMTWDDRLLAGRLSSAGIHIHTVPQARTHGPYDGRPGCTNFGTCGVCPIGARYAPNHHIQLALKTGRLTLHTRAAVRRITVGPEGRATGIVYHADHAPTESEHFAKVVVLAAGTIESVRLLLLSTDSRHPDGLGNRSGHVGRHFTLGQYHYGYLHFKEPLYPGRAGPRSAHSQQFINHESKRQYGGLKIGFASQGEHRHLGRDPQFTRFWGRPGAHSGAGTSLDNGDSWRDGAEILERLRPIVYCRTAGFECQTVPSERKYISLSEKRDRFGARIAHVHHQREPFDHEAQQFARSVFHRMALALKSTEAVFDEGTVSGHHHFGGCRMSSDPVTGVVDTAGRIHDAPNVFVLGSSVFPNASVANPTLTIVALAMRTTDYIIEQLRGN
jgi:choline dehydrogenase-like flavoprotein